MAAQLFSWGFRVPNLPDRLLLGINDDNSKCFLAVKDLRHDALLLTAAEVDATITTLMNVRALMTPAHMSQEEEMRGASPGNESHAATAMHWHLGMSQISKRARLALHHPGLGWIAAHLDEADLLKLQADAQRLASSTQAGSEQVNKRPL